MEQTTVFFCGCQRSPCLTVTTTTPLPARKEMKRNTHACKWQLETAAREGRARDGTGINAQWKRMPDHISRTTYQQETKVHYSKLAIKHAEKLERRQR